MKASLRRRTLAEHTYSYTIECEHGKTLGLAAIAPDSGVSETQIIAELLEKHHAEERCSCCNDLRQQFGLPIEAA